MDNIDFPDFDYSKPHGRLDGVPYYLNEQEIAELEQRKASGLRIDSTEALENAEGA